MKFEIIKKEIDEWDPIDLLGHTPPDEYDAESREILSKLQCDVNKNGMMIYEVFSNAFGTTFNKSIDECVCIAEKISRGQGDGSVVP